MPYKDKYMEYLRGVKRRQEKAEQLKAYNEKYYELNKVEIKKQQHDTQQKWHEEHREYYNTRSRAEQHCSRHKLPMAEACELCPEDDKRTTKLQRHHVDYDYPEIYVTVCTKCHKETHLWQRAHAYENNKEKRGDC
jgi:hypothetical protein